MNMVVFVRAGAFNSIIVNLLALVDKYEES